MLRAKLTNSNSHPASNRAQYSSLARFQGSALQKTRVLSDMTEQFNNTHSVRKAAETVAKEHGLSKDQVRGLYRRSEKSAGRSHGNRRFSDEEEETFVAFLEARSICHRPMARLDFIELITAYDHQARGPSEWTARAWYDGFKERHKDRINTRTTKAISPARTSPLTEAEVNDWVDRFERWMTVGRYSWKNLVNVDEMRLKLFNSSSSSKAIVSNLVSRPNELTGTRGKMASFIPFVTASGERILDVLVLPISFGNLQIHDPDAGKRQKDAIPIRLVFSETGFLTEEQWIPVLAEFKASWNSFHPSLTPVLLMDNLGVHKTADALDSCLKLGIQGFFLPANSTHFLQPLDDAIFANLKRKIVRLFQHKRSFHNCTFASLGSEMIPIVLEARKSLSKKWIMDSFRHTGIYPWSKETIRKNALLNIADAPSLEGALPQVATQLLKVFDSRTTGSLVNKVSGNMQSVLKLNKTYSIQDLHQTQQEAVETKAAKRKAIEESKENRKRVKEAKDAADIAKKEASLCQAITNNDRCATFWKRSTAWLNCDICGKYRICPAHKYKFEEQFMAHVEAHDLGSH